MDREVNETTSLVKPTQSQAALAVIRQAAGEWWDNWFALATLGLVWLLASLTVVLTPPALFGLAYALRSILQGEAPSVGDWWRGTRQYFGQAWLLAFINLVLAVLFWTNIWFYGQIGTPLADGLRWVFLPLSLIWLVIQFYAVSFLLEQERKHLGLALRNGFYLMLAAPLYTLMVGGVALGLLILTLLLIAPLLLGVPALILLLSSYAVTERITAYQLR
ncbi:MAG: hypothetical protein AB1522_08500 [Chloroflexota bacterium]